MADDSKTSKTVKSATDAIVGQVITEFTKPAVDKIPASVLRILKSVGLDKALPIISVALSTIFSKEKYAWGDKFGDFTAEATAELRRAINEKIGDGEGETPADKKTTAAEGVKSLNRILLNPRLAKETAILLTALAELFKDKDGNDRTEKEKKQIFALLNQMGGKELYVFLSSDKEVRECYLDAFVKKATEKSFEEALKDFKTDLKKLVEKAKIVYAEIIVPSLDKLDEWTGATADGDIGPAMKKVDDAVNQFCDFMTNFAKPKTI